MKLENERRREECKKLFEMLAKEREKMSDDLLRETSQVRDILQNDQKARNEEQLTKDKQVPFLVKRLQFVEPII